MWHEVALTGSTAAEFSEQIEALEPFLAKVWQARHSAKTGNPIYERPVALVIYRDDFRFLLDEVIPRQGRARADYDLVIASQPYRARVPVEFKAAKVIAPLTRALRPGGRLLGIHSCGRDPGLEIVRKMWPDEDPFKTSRHDILRAVRAELGRDARHYNFNAYADQRAVFRYDMHTLPTEIADVDRHLDPVRRLERRRLRRPRSTTSGWPRCSAPRKYLDATREVLQAHGACGSSMNPTSSRAREADDDAPCRPDAAHAHPPAPAHPTSPRIAAELVACGSLEMGADAPRGRRSASPTLLPAGTPVYVNHLPRRRARRHPARADAHSPRPGLEPVPHVAVRRIASRAEAEAFLKRGGAPGRRAQGAADRRRRAGAARAPTREGAALLRDGLLVECGVAQVGLRRLSRGPSAHRHRPR